MTDTQTPPEPQPTRLVGEHGAECLCGMWIKSAYKSAIIFSPPDRDGISHRRYLCDRCHRLAHNAILALRP